MASRRRRAGMHLASIHLRESSVDQPGHFPRSSGFRIVLLLVCYAANYHGFSAQEAWLGNGFGNPSRNKKMKATRLVVVARWPGENIACRQGGTATADPEEPHSQLTSVKCILDCPLSRWPLASRFARHRRSPSAIMPALATSKPPTVVRRTPRGPWS